jgi:tripartite-type tricarboxylate transporter receptor subunit TctC
MELALVPEQCTKARIRKLLASAALAALALPLPLSAQTTYPSKPLRFVVPYPPGAGTDVVARLIGTKLTESWGQPVVMDFRPGASATLGPDVVAKSPPDGYTFVIVTSTFTMTPGLQKVPYDPVRDFTPVVMFAAVPNVLVVHPSLPVRSTKALIQLARARPGELTFGSSGNGSVPHLATEMLRMIAAPLDIVHVPYRGNNPALTALFSGEISMTIISMPTAVPFITSGRVRALAVTSARRSQAAPQVPTLAESGAPGYDFASEWGILLPAKVPPEIVGKLYGEVARIIKMPDIAEKLANQGAEPRGTSPDEYAASIRANLARWQKVIRAANIRPD